MDQLHSNVLLNRGYPFLNVIHARSGRAQSWYRRKSLSDQSNLRFLDGFCDCQVFSTLFRT